MKKLFSRLGRYKFTWTTLLLSAIAIPAVWLSLDRFIELWPIAATLAYMTLGSAAYGVADNIYLKNHNTDEILSRDPVAFAIAWSGFGFVIGCALIAGAIS